MNFLSRVSLIIIAKFIYQLSVSFQLGAGGTWPGEVLLRFKPDILPFFASQVKKGIIIVAGTNGKTTTTLMIKKILESKRLKVLHNDSGANLLNGIVSAFIQSSSLTGKIDAYWGVFEVDENALPIVLKFIKSIKLKAIVLLNLFRDQLDRYGELDVIAEKWGKALARLPEDTKIILNADDPQIAYLGKNLKAEVIFFGIDDPKSFLETKEHATDSIFCLKCGNRLSFAGVYYSHIGIWRCDKCGEKRPTPDLNRWKSPLPGLYNQYNTLAAVSAAKSLGISDSQIKETLADFSPAFGRQEVFEINGKKIKIFLSKNPAGYNETLRTVINLGAKKLLFVLNDRIPDGKDVSWIWDVDFETIPDNVSVIVSGDRAYDMGLRIKYAARIKKLKLKIKNYNAKLKIIKNLREAIATGLDLVKEGETLYILPTYSAMLEVRKILKGRKIL